MRYKTVLLAAALTLPGQAVAAPLCATLKAVRTVAESDKWMASLKAAPEQAGEWTAARQIDGFKCVITTGATTGMTRGFYNCTWNGPKETQPVAATLDAIGKCFAVAPTVEKKSYATTTSFALRAAPRMWIAANAFNSGKFSFSLIAE